MIKFFNRKLGEARIEGTEHPRINKMKHKPMMEDLRKIKLETVHFGALELRPYMIIDIQFIKKETQSGLKTSACMRRFSLKTVILPFTN